MTMGEQSASKPSGHNLSGGGAGPRSGLAIKKAGPEDYSALLEIWEAAVRATHDFLNEDDIQSIRVQVKQLLPKAEGLVVAWADGRPVGFMGLTLPGKTVGGQAEIDMLFITPDRHGQGVGTAMIDFARQQCPRLKLSVNEQNPKARIFYEHRGFVVVGRSMADSQGRHFPLLHMSTTVG